MRGLGATHQDFINLYLKGDYITGEFGFILPSEYEEICKILNDFNFIGGVEDGDDVTEALRRTAAQQLYQRMVQTRLRMVHRRERKFSCANEIRTLSPSIAAKFDDQGLSLESRLGIVLAFTSPSMRALYNPETVCLISPLSDATEILISQENRHDAYKSAVDETFSTLKTDAAFDLLADLATGPFAVLDQETIRSAKLVFLTERPHYVPDADTGLALRNVVTALIAATPQREWKDLRLKVNKIMREIMIAATINNPFHFVIENTQAVMDLAALYQELVIAPLPPL